MIGPGTGIRVYLACGVTDMRKGIAWLAQCLHSGGDAVSHCPAIHVYMCERGVKLLYWDGQGFCLYYKVLERGRFPWPNAKDGAVRMTSAQLAMRWAPLAHARMRLSRCPTIAASSDKRGAARDRLAASGWGAPPARAG